MDSTETKYRLFFKGKDTGIRTTEKRYSYNDFLEKHPSTDAMEFATKTSFEVLLNNVDVMVKMDAHKIGTSELSLKVEGKFTNLRIWISDGGIYMRLDRANQYSAPLCEKSYNYLEKDNKIIKELSNMGFPTNINNLKKIEGLIACMEQRDCIAW